MILSLLAATIVFFSPRGGCTDAITKEIGRAKQSIFVQAYSFTSEPIAKALIDARKTKHLDIQVILDRNWPVQSPKVEPLLIEGGISVFIDARHAIAHNKVIVIDEATVITGSFNFTRQAELQNAENLLVIRDKKLASAFVLNWRAHAAHSLTALP